MKVSKQNVAVIGQGYVGLPLSLVAAKSGWNVTGIEIDATRFSLLSLQMSPIEGIDSTTIKELMSQGRYRVDIDFRSLSDADIIIVCVPTPLDLHGKSDLSALNSVVDAIHKFGKQGALIINESTSYPGTLRSIFSEKLENTVGIQRFDYAVAPERIDPGNAQYKIENTPRVIGALSEIALGRAQEFYETFCSHVVKVTSPEVAEMAKLLENTFRLVNISLINELSMLSSRIGVNTREVVDAASTKPFGFMRFLPSIGIGGHCIPIDPVYLAEYSQDHGVEQTLIKSAKEVDDAMAPFIVERVKHLFPDIHRVTVIGIGYKAGSSDTRHSPSIRLIQALRDSDYEVDWLDSTVKQFDKVLSKTDLNSQLAILVSADAKFDAEKYLLNGGRIMDFTGSLKLQKGVVQL